MYICTYSVQLTALYVDICFQMQDEVLVYCGGWGEGIAGSRLHDAGVAEEMGAEAGSRRVGDQGGYRVSLHLAQLLRLMHPPRQGKGTQGSSPHRPPCFLLLGLAVTEKAKAVGVARRRRPVALSP